MNKHYKLLLKRLLLCSLLAGSAVYNVQAIPSEVQQEDADLDLGSVFGEQDSTTADITPTPDVAVITEELEEQKAELALLEQEKTIETKELAKVEEKLEDVKILPIEPIAPIRKEVVVCKLRLAKTNDEIGICKRKIYLLEQAKLKAARQAAALEAAEQPKKQQTIQEFYGVKKTPKRKSRIRRGRAVKSGKHGKLKKRHTKRKRGATKRKQARKQTQQTTE